MQDAIDDIPLLLGEHKKYNIVQFGNSYYAVPQCIGKWNPQDNSDLNRPEILSARRVGKLKQLINEAVANPYWHPCIAENYKECNLVVFKNLIYVTPAFLGEINFFNIEPDRRAIIQTAKDLAEARQMVDSLDFDRFKPRYIETRRDHTCVEMFGSFYGFHNSLGDKKLRDLPINEWYKKILSQPTLIKARTEEELREKVEAVDPALWQVTALGEYRQYRLFQHARFFYGIHRSRGKVNLLDKEQERNIENIKRRTRKETEHAIDERYRSKIIEYAGWLPVFKNFGNCGQHPQFVHLGMPPEGYAFSFTEDRVVRDKTARSLFAYTYFFIKFFLWLLWPCFRYARSAKSLGAKTRDIIKFILSRDIKSQLVLPSRCRLALLPSVPFTLGQIPWVIEIEDTVSLFYPFIHNGKTSSMDIKKHYSYPLIKAIIESDSCKGLLTHVRSTAESIPKLFNNDKLKDKVVYRPFGIQKPLINQETKKKSSGTVSFLFTNSWHQDPHSFYIRGGLDILEAFEQLYKKFGDRVQLIIRSRLPDKIGPKYKTIIKNCNVQVLNEFLPEEELMSLFVNADVYLLPSDRIHVVSLLQAMSYKKAIITSDGWAISEYIKDGYNGIVVPGRYGKITWMDEKTGILNENYKLMSKADLPFVENLIKAMTRLVEDEALRQTIGHNAFRDIEEKFNVKNWNEGMKELFEMALQG